MKYAFVLGTLNPGGMETQATNLAIELQKMGHELSILLPCGEGAIPSLLPHKLKEAGVQVIDLTPLPDKRGAITGCLYRMEPDAVCGFGYPLTITTLHAAHMAGVSNSVARYESCGIKRRYSSWASSDKDQDIAHEYASSILGNSWAVINSLREFGGIDFNKVHVIHNGVAIPQLNQESRRRARKGIDDKTIVVGLLANFRVDGLKNQKMAVKAMEQLRKLPILLVMYGYSSEYQQEVERDIKMFGLQDKVKIMGQASNLDMLAGWDIAINTSHTEGLSNAIMECMAYGLPIIATAVGGNPELVKDGQNGILINDKDCDALATQIIKLAVCKELRLEYGNAGRKLMIEEYNWKKIATEWVNFLSERENTDE